jgi:hypothetical protein
MLGQRLEKSSPDIFFRSSRNSLIQSCPGPGRVLLFAPKHYFLKVLTAHDTRSWCKISLEWQVPLRYDFSEPSLPVRTERGRWPEEVALMWHTSSARMSGEPSVPGGERGQS